MNDDAAAVYAKLVKEIIDARPTTSAYQPTVVLDLTIVNSRMPVSIDELHPDELRQLRAAFHPESLEAALAEVEESLSVEVAEVVDETGTLRYRLYGWDFGVGYLFPPTGLDVVAAGFQHDIEHWSLDQRDLFAAMDRAQRKGSHGFYQPLAWCWTKDECWDELSPSFNSQSQQYLRHQFAALEANGQT